MLLSKILFEAKNISKSFGGLQAVKDVSCSVYEKQIKAVIGPNGAGKTTFFNLITGVFPLSAGEMLFEGKDVTGFKPFRLTKKGISRTFQNILLFNKMTVVENVMVGQHCRTKCGFLRSMLPASFSRAEEKAIRAKAMEELEFVGLADLAGSVAGSLAYGQQRTLEIARALATEPKVLLLDEPAAGLNNKETAVLGNLIYRIRDRGISVVLIEHDMRLVMEVSEEIMVLNHGTKIAEGTPRQIQSNPLVLAAYLGEEEKNA